MSRGTGETNVSVRLGPDGTGGDAAFAPGGRGIPSTKGTLR